MRTGSKKLAQNRSSNIISGSFPPIAQSHSKITFLGADIDGLPLRRKFVHYHFEPSDPNPRRRENIEFERNKFVVQNGSTRLAVQHPTVYEPATVEWTVKDLDCHVTTV